MQETWVGSLGWEDSLEGGHGNPFQYSWASLVAQTVKNPPEIWEMWVWSLCWEDTLERKTATHSSILAWKIPWTEEPGGLQSMGTKSRIWLSDYHYDSWGFNFLVFSSSPPAILKYIYSIVLKWKLPSHVWLFVTPWTVAHHAPLSMEFSKQEYWSGLPFLSQIYGTTRG